MTPLHNIDLNFSIQIAEFLISHDADINAKDKYGCIPISGALENNCIFIYI